MNVRLPRFTRNNMYFSEIVQAGNEDRPADGKSKNPVKQK